MHHRSAFSLIEIAIVLVILGLLVGGVIAGRNLIEAAEIRNTAQSIEKFSTAMYTFSEKYRALPGDMRNATTFWGNAINGAMNGDCTDSNLDIGTGTQTCNGNNNRMFDLTSERFRFWQHLSNSGIIGGNYLGARVTTVATGRETGVNIPEVAIAPGGITVTNDADAEKFPNARNINLFQIGNFSNDWPDLELFTTEQALLIDRKLDDGRPGVGDVTSSLSTAPNTPNCTTTDVADTSEYDLTEEGVKCFLVFDIN